MIHQPLPITSVHKSHDRLGFTVIMALAFHAALILGISFDFESLPEGKQSSRLEITLAQYNQNTQPEEADFIAQHNQTASGSLQDKQKLTTTELAPLESSRIYEIQQEQQQKKQIGKRPVITTSAQSNFSISPDENHEAFETQSKQDQPLTPKLAREIASIEAELDKLRQDYAKGPKTKRITSVATKASPEARYLFKWEQRIEQIGNHYYPAEARAQKIYGNLRLKVTIHPNGSLDKVVILQSSGHKLLDQAAIDIVKRSAPFKPLPAGMMGNAERLEIIRTWQFQRNFVTH